jgi:hypothetical protein
MRLEQPRAAGQANRHDFGAKAWHTRARFGVRLEPSGWGGGSPTNARVNLLGAVGSGP